MTIIDTHAHLDHIENLDQALVNADKAGVEGIVAVSIDAASCRKNLEINRTTKQPKIYLAMGMHPSACSSFHSSLAQDIVSKPRLQRGASNNPSDADPRKLQECVELIREYRGELTAIGEIGLDFWYPWARKDKEKKDGQRAVFRTMLELAQDMELPAIVHTRGTWRECFETVKEMGLRKAEFHWYSGPIDVLKDILDKGYYISAAPSLAYSPQSREAIGYAPIDRIMIETDSPVYYRGPASEDGNETDAGFQAEPKDVFKTLKAYCALKGFDEINAVDIFNRNAKEFFCLD